MNGTKIRLSMVALATLALIATPALAGQRGGGNNRGGGGAPRGGAAGARPSAPRGGAASARPSGPRGGAPRGGAGGRVAPRVIGPRGFVGGSPRFYRPYYTFRPRVSLGFGLWVGYPIAYPYYYGYGYSYAPYSYSYPYSYPYPYAYPYAYPSYGYPTRPYGYPAPNPPYYTNPSSTYPAQPSTPGSIDVEPGQTASGGVSFEITPDTAELYVDGAYVGTVATFGPTSQPLTLTPGRHRIQLRAAGYDSLAFGVDVTAGQVIPYQGTMQPQRPD